MTASGTTSDIGADTELVQARRRAVLDAMAHEDLDVLVLGRQDDATWASGAERLWTAGTRPIGAGCVVVRTDDPLGRIHLLSSWDAGVPASIPFGDLLPLTWNPQNLSQSLASIDGLPSARRIGVDAWSPGLASSMGRIAPDAEIVVADEVLAALRRRKLAPEIERIRAACSVVARGIAAAVAAHLDGVTSSGHLAAAAIEAMADVGATVPSSGVTAHVEGDALVIDIGMVVDQYEGGAGGRFVGGVRTPAPSPLVDACRAGATWSDLAAAATDATWLVRGVGMGYERPVLTPDLGRDEVLDAGVVVSVTDGPSRVIVAVTDDEPDLLSVLAPDRPG